MKKIFNFINKWFGSLCSGFGTFLFLVFIPAIFLLVCLKGFSGIAYFVCKVIGPIDFSDIIVVSTNVNS